MKKKTALIGISAIILLLTIIFCITQSSNYHTMKKRPEKRLEIQADPIVIIRNNSAFTLYATSGDGTPSNPYILENLVIDGNSKSDNCIDIQNTNAHFIIRNCVLTSGDIGIYCENVNNGQFQNNQITNSYYGVYCVDTNNTQALYNNISQCDYGIYYDEAWYHTASHNILDYNGIGLETEYTYYLTAINNTCSYTTSGQSFYLWGVNCSTFINNKAIHCDTAEAFYIDDSCWNNSFITNFVSNCSIGFYLVDNSKYNVFDSNQVYFTTNNGWELGTSGTECSYNTFINNSALFGESDGFYLDEIPHSIFINNTALNNTGNGFVVSLVSDFTYNKAENNTGDGFYVSASNHSLSYNTAINNGAHGIHLDSSDFNSISFNIANENTLYGIFLEKSDDNNISWNIVHNNAQCINETNSVSNYIANNSCNAATLMSGTFTPASGDKKTLFNFTVIYTDIDNMAPFSIKLFVDDVPYDMVKLNPSDNNFTDGCVYTVVTKLPKGDSQIYFEAYEITNQIVTSQIPGPSVKGGIPWISFYFILSTIGLTIVFFAKYRQKLE
ncbi:MAG: NosD domain-containing protein [Candidatus Helarchaeota archaeon]